MLDGGVKKVAINIDPPELGPLGIELRFLDNKANVTFISHNPEVKGLIEGAAPKLENMFAEQKLELGQLQVDISPQQQSTGDQYNAFKQSGTKAHAMRNKIATIGNDTSIARSSLSLVRGYVDYYA